jgi:Holliday junction resolvase RusA-like endonuclease
VSRWGAYFPKSYETYRADVQRQLAEQITKGAREAGLLDGTLAVVIDVACTKPRTGKLQTPRGDVDNFAKGPLDAATKVGLWTDDTQVASLAVSKRYRDADEEAGIGIWVGQIA